MHGKTDQRQAGKQHQRLIDGHGDHLAGMPLLLDVGKPRRMEAFGNVNRNAGTVPEGRADPPEVIEMLVADDQRFDLALPQHLVDAFLGEAPIHPGRIPAGVEQQAAHGAVGRFGFQQRREAGGVVGVQRAERRPGNGVLIGLGAAGLADVAEHGGGVEPAGFGNAADLQSLQGADIESLGSR